MKALLTAMIGMVMVIPAMAEPEITGTPAELTSHLSSIPGQVTLGE